MRTIVIIGGIILAGATTIAVIMNDRSEPVQPVGQSQGITPDPVAAPVSGTAQLNPKHGMPGHRCDLAVGAPLTTPEGASAPAAAPPAPPVININPSPQPQTAPAASATPAGLKVNPAHGMPGHRCDLKVGDPL